jgi:hypothetical protein
MPMTISTDVIGARTIEENVQAQRRRRGSESHPPLHGGVAFLDELFLKRPAQHSSMQNRAGAIRCAAAGELSTRIVDATFDAQKKKKKSITDTDAAPRHCSLRISRAAKLVMPFARASS